MLQNEWNGRLSLFRSYIYSIFNCVKTYQIMNLKNFLLQKIACDRLARSRNGQSKLLVCTFICLSSLPNVMLMLELNQININISFRNTKYHQKNNKKITFVMRTIQSYGVIFQKILKYRTSKLLVNLLHTWGFSRSAICDSDAETQTNS